MYCRPLSLSRWQSTHHGTLDFTTTVRMSFLLIAFLLGLLLLIHELGHFLAARWMGIPVARFSIGLGPKL